MKKLFNILKEKLAPLSSKLQSLKSILPQKKPHSEKYYKRIAFLNKYSLIFHFLLACLLILAVETISRRDFVSAITFISNHTLAFLYNALIIFASLSLVYLTKYRTQMRILISGLWIFLGTFNGLILSNHPGVQAKIDHTGSLFHLGMSPTFKTIRATKSSRT